VSWLGKIRRVGPMVEPAPAAPDVTLPPPTGITGSLQLRHVDAGSCNGCELEISGAFSPMYDAERFGARLVASPRHADALLATGVVTHNMYQPLLNTLHALPEPRIVIAVGDCACNGGVFTKGYGVVGPVGDVVPVDVEVPGCPPTPQEIITALRKVTGR
jgi:formate hydrogenlyase subunit 7